MAARTEPHFDSSPMPPEPPDLDPITLDPGEFDAEPTGDREPSPSPAVPTAPPLIEEISDSEAEALLPTVDVDPSEESLDIDIDEEEPDASDDASVELPIAVAAVEEIEEIEEFEEIDDIELLEEEEGAPAPRPPAPPVAPPMPPPTAAPPPAPPVAPSPQADAVSPIVPQLVEPDAQSVLDRLLDGRKAMDWELRAQELSRQLESEEEPTRIGELAYELGEIYLRNLGDEQRAAKAYGRALQSDPSLRANLWAIRRVFYSKGLWPNLLKLIGAELRFVTKAEDRAALLLERAHVQEQGLQSPGEALESYVLALDALPRDPAALYGLLRVARSTGDKDATWRALEGLAEHAADPEQRVSYAVELAREYRLAHERLDVASELLSEAAKQGVLSDWVSREREALARATEDWSGLSSVIEARIARLLEGFGEAGPPGIDSEGHDLRLQRIISLRRQQAQLCARQEDQEGAWHCLSEALTLMPDSKLLLADLSDLAEKLGRYDELADLAAAREQGEADPARALSLALRRAAALAKAGKTADADELLRSRAQTRPGYLPILSARELLAARRGDWGELVSIQRELADSLRLGTSFGEESRGEADALAAAGHYLVAGDLLRFLAGDEEGARECYAQSLEVSPDYRLALWALVSLHLGAHRFDEAAELLERHKASGSAQERASVLESLANAYFLARRGTDELAAVDELAALQSAEGMDGVGSLRWRQWELCRELGLWERFVQAGDAAYESEGDPELRAMVAFEIAAVQLDELHAPAEALPWLYRALDQWPESALLEERLHEALAASGQWDRLRERLQIQFDRREDGPGLAVLGRRLLQLLSKGDELAEGSDEPRQQIRRIAERCSDDAGLLFDALFAADLMAEEESGQELTLSMIEMLAPQCAGSIQTVLQLWAGRLCEQTGRIGEAEDFYRRAVDAGSTEGALALIRMAARQGDAGRLADGLRGLASMLDDSKEQAELLVLAGWQQAAMLDEAGALETFRSASERAPESSGASLGALLLSAKQVDRIAAGNALEQLAGSAKGRYLQSALLVRSALLAEVQGDEARARERLAAARQVAPQDAGTAIVAADHLAPLPPEPLFDSATLAERAELCEMRAVLSDTGASRFDWELERAEALEALGRLKEAGQALASVLDQRPNDLRALHALIRICRRGGDRSSLARASVSLADLLGDPQAKLEHLREASAIYDQELSDIESSVACYRRILEQEPGAPEYERLVEILVEHRDLRTLYQCYSARLHYLEREGASRERVPILYARAKLRRDIGDMPGASRDLAKLLDIDAVHVGALGAHAQILERLGHAREAAELYGRYVEVELDTSKKSEAERALSFLLADNLDDVEGAIAQIEQVLRQSPRDIDLRERLVSLLLKAERAQDAAKALRELSKLRGSDGERARDELRASQHLRDAGDRAGALDHAQRARQYSPLNIDAVRELIALVGGDQAKRNKMLDSALHDMRGAIETTPTDSGLYERLATLCQWREDEAGEFFALQALRLTGSMNSERSKRLGELKGRVRTELSEIEPMGDDAWNSQIQHRGARGASAQLWQVIGPVVSRLEGITAQEMGFEKSDRSKTKLLARERPRVAELCALFRVPEPEVYVSPGRKGVARSISDEAPVLCLGTDIADADEASQRFALARAVAHARSRTGSLAMMEEGRLLLYMAAAVQAAGVETTPAALSGHGEAARVRELAKSIIKELGRKGRKDLGLLASRCSELLPPADYRNAAMLSAARAGLLICGDLEIAFDVLDVGQGGRSLADDRVAQGLLAWAVSARHLSLRQSLKLEGRNG